MAIRATIGGNTVTVLEGSYKFDGTVDLRKILEFVVHDPTGAIVYTVGQPVSLDDDVNGFTFSGYVNAAKETNITPNDDNLFDITCSDETGLAARRYSYKDYENQFAGDIAVDLLESCLRQDGVTAAYAIRRDTNQADFAQGTLSGTVGANNVGDGDLELAPAGSTLTHDFGSVYNATTKAIKFVASAAQGYQTDYLYVKVWSGSQVIASGDYLSYDMWISSSSPEIKASVDVVCTDGTAFSTSVLSGNDGQGLNSNPANDLSGFANDQWYSRGMGVQGALIGKTIAYVALVFGGTQNGTYTAYFRNVTWDNTSTGLKNTFFGLSQTALQQFKTMQNSGYYNISATVVDADEYKPGFNTSAPIDLSGVGIAGNSAITWELANYTNPALGFASDASVVVKTSIDDGVTWQVCTSGQAIPSITPGMNLSGVSIQVQTELIAGIDPTINSSTASTTIQIHPAAQAAKTDVKKSYASNADFSSGAFSNVTAPSGGGLALSGSWTYFAETSDYNGVTTLYGNSPADFIYLKQLGVECLSGAGNDGRVRLDFAGTWQNFIAEVDLRVVSNLTTVGLVYRTTNWGNSYGSQAYSADISTTTVYLNKGSNSASNGSQSTLVSATINFNANSWHHLMVVVSGNTHNIYVDDILYISFTDSSYTAAGYVALRIASIGANTGLQTTYFKNFGISSALSGTWTSPAISLSPAVVYGNSVIDWDTASLPNGATIAVQVSVDGGVTYQLLTNGGAIPQLSAGTALTGLTLTLKVTLSTTSTSFFPVTSGISVLVLGQYSASGYRIAPALPLSPVGIVGSTLCSWDGVEPANCTMAVATSIDKGLTWQTVGSGASGSGAISGITVQPEAIDDTFDTNTSANYTQTQLVTPATWTWDTANSRLTATGGNGAILEYTGLSFTDGDTMVDLDQVDGSGPLARVSGNTMYALVLYDSQATAHQNVFFLYAIVSGTFTQIATGAITFTRGTPYRFHLVTDGSTITATMDGETLASVTDAHIVNPGTCGIMSGTLTRAYQLRIQQYGEDVSDLTVLTKVATTSIDPTATPQLTGLTLSAYGPDIQPGALVPKANYSVLSGTTNTIAANLDDLVKRCDNFVWDINKYKQMRFRKRTANPSPWIASGADILISTVPQIENISDLYRNVQLASNGTDIQPLTKTFVGDGQTQTWTLDYPVDSLALVTINGGTTYTIGVKGVDTGRDFYYQPGSPVLSQDSAKNPLVLTQSVTFAYNAQVTIAAELRDDAAIAARAAVDSTTGVVQAVMDGTNLSKVAILQKMQGLLQQYALDGRTFTFLTKRAGLEASQMLTMFVPQFSVFDEQFLITDVSVVWKTTMENNIEVAQPFYSVTATSGPVTGDYTRWLSNIIQGVSA